MRVFIMRGMPGSGKSHWAHNQQCSKVVCSADDGHIVNDKYVFKPENISRVHLSCKFKFLDVVDPLRVVRNDQNTIIHPDIVIVDNTNTTAWEIAWYWDTAVLFGHQLKIVRIHRSLEWCLTHNTHKVPDKTMWQMYQNIMNEKLPQHWTEEIICPENKE